MSKLINKLFKRCGRTCSVTEALIQAQTGQRTKKLLEAHPSSLSDDEQYQQRAKAITIAPSTSNQAWFCSPNRHPSRSQRRLPESVTR